MTGRTEVPWRRLAPSIIWVDAAAAVASLTPMAIAVLVVGAPMDSWAVWTTAVVAGAGLLGAASDVWRWWKTRYRVTSTHVERRTGLAVRNHRSIRRDRIRGVDATATLRHRIVGLSVVTIGAGQQASGEEAFTLDAVDVETVAWLRRELLGSTPEVDSDGTPIPNETVLAVEDPRWIVHNALTIWSFVLAAGLAWGGYWAVQPFGIDSPAMLERLLAWNPMSTTATVAVVVAAMGAFGVVAMAVNHIGETWGFRLVRTEGEDAVLRSVQGLFSTREVNRDVARIRGVEIGEPLALRFLGTTETDVISTGLTGFTLKRAAGSTILPRTPRRTAIRVAHDALGTDDAPLSAPLSRHPRRALRRRLTWAIGVGTATLAAGIAIAPWWWIPGSIVAVAAPVLAVASYRSLGHATVGAFLVVRSGGVHRRTSALRSDAVIGWSFERSPFQRRLGLTTVTASTSAGTGGYRLIDADATDAVEFARVHSPDLLRPFLVDDVDD